MNEKQAIYQARSLTSQAPEGFISYKLAHTSIFFLRLLFCRSSGTAKNTKVVGLLSLGNDLGIKTSFRAFGREQMKRGEGGVGER